MTFSLRLDDRDSQLVKNYAELNKISVSELFRQAVMERIEAEYDLRLYDKAYAEYRENQIAYTLDAVEAELGLG